MILSRRAKFRRAVVRAVELAIGLAAILAAIVFVCAVASLLLFLCGVV